MEKLEKVPRNKWTVTGKAPSFVYLNDRFLVQEFVEGVLKVRLTINRVEILTFDVSGDPIWKEGITWDELQEIKNMIGYEKHWMVELYPPEKDVVNVANMRHLWVIPEPKFGWKNSIDE